LSPSASGDRRKFSVRSFVSVIHAAREADMSIVIGKQLDSRRPESARAGLAAITGLGSNEDLFWTLAAHTPVGIFVSDAAGSCVYVNERWSELTGLSSEQALGDGWAAALHPEDSARVSAEWGAAAGVGRDSIVEYRFRRPDGSVSWIQGFASAIRDLEGAVAGWVGTCLDLTAQKEVESELQRLADSDPLTGLLNRRCFSDELEREVARINRHGGTTAVLMIDLDRFKLINDTLGHRAGDDVLCAVGDRLAERIRATDVVARVGGDEFAVIAHTDAHPKHTAELAHELAEAIRGTPVATCQTHVSIRASIGAATIVPGKVGCADDALVAADNAMYRAKRLGGDRIADAA
jgi:diguanylate cyclase (GGDEF)-like protein/PAS domain S-box-containing protein